MGWADEDYQYGRRYDRYQSSTGPVNVDYSDSYFNDHYGLWNENGYHKAAAACAISSCVIGIGVATALWPPTCRAYSKTGLVILAALLLLCFVLQALVFLVFESDFCDVTLGGCKLLGFGIVNIITCVLWALCAFLVVF